MRYKEQVEYLIEKIENLLNQMEQQINKNETRESVLQTLSRTKERMEQLHSQISVEPGEFLTSK